jgi:zinc protease
VSKLIATAFALPALATSAAMASPAMPAETTGDVLPFKATEKNLANGMKIIVVPTCLQNLVSVTIPLRTASRNGITPAAQAFAE